MILINLFSVFDPTSYLKISFNWIVIFVLFIFLYQHMYICKSGYLLFINKVMILINNLFKEIARNNYLGIASLSLVSFLFLCISNILGLFPFVFTRTAHAVVTIGLGLVIWIGFFLIGFIKNFKNSIAHLVPEGRPLLLSPVLVLIESIRQLMRPFTLSIRLTANIMAGHLIVGLISRIRINNIFSFRISLFIQRIVLVLEIGVAIIQGFVFRILLMLYSLEYY